MKFIKIIQNIFSFNLTAKLLIRNNGDILNLDEDKQFHLNSSRYVNYINESTIIILNNRNLGFFIKQDGLEKFDNEIKIIGHTDKYLLLYDRQNNTKSVYSIFDKTTILKCDYEIGSFLGMNFLVTDFDSYIKLVQISSGNNLPPFPLSSLGSWLDGAIEKPYQVSEFSGLYENTLVCTMNSGSVLLLDIEKGEIKKFFKDAKVRGGIYQTEENNPIYRGLKHYTFIEINAETGELLRQVDIQNELKRVANIPSESPCWLSVGTSIYQDGLFYFYGDGNFVAIFDPITEKIIDYHWFEFNIKQYQQLKGGVENLQVKDGKIYCLDTLGNLHELER